MRRGETDMIMIIGGAHQGKRRYAERRYPDKRWIDGEVCGEDEIFHCEGICHFHEYIAERMREGADLSELPERLYAENPGIVIVTDEIGYGIVPADAFQRKYRECTGRICTELAARSEEVHRVICGIGMKIK